MDGPADSVPTPEVSRRRFLGLSGALVGGLGCTLGYGLGAHYLLRRERWTENTSYWVASTPRPEAAAPLRGSTRCDVAIVGGGFTGLSAALHIKRAHPELALELIEARRLGFGASGRNGGQMVDHTANFERLPGATDNVAFLKGLIAAEGLECGLLGNDLNPYALVLELARVAREAGVVLHEHSQVQSVETGPPAKLVGDSFELECDKLILCTNAYTPRLGFLARELAPIHSGVLVTEPLGDRAQQIPQRFSEPIRGGSDYYWGGRLPDSRVLFGGGLRYSYDNGLDFEGAPDLYRALRRGLGSLFPAAREAPIAAAWTGPQAFFADMNPRILDLEDNVIFAGGYAGMGITMSVRFGRLVAEKLDGGRPPEWTARPAPWVPGEPLRYMGLNAAFHLVDLGWVQV